jgi:hypothetical protein
MFGIIYSYGVILQVIAIVHFIRRRPDGYWLWIILIGGGVGALVYIVVEVAPDFWLLQSAFQAFPRRKRIKLLEAAILDNPSVGNYEELGELYLDDRQFARARECFDKVVGGLVDSPDAFYRRALCELAMGDLPAAAADLEVIVKHDPRYDYQRAAGLLADTLGKIGRSQEAQAAFEEVLQTSTLSETQYNYASFLAAAGRNVEAREWAQRILAKKPTMPAFVRRRERPWFRKATALLKKLPKAA